MDLKLDGKVALVTGSSKGLGEGVARGLAREGTIVIIHGRNRIKAEEVAHDISVEGRRAYVVIGDLTNEDEVQRLVDEAQAFVTPVEIVINNAGGSGETEDWTTTRSETWAAGYDRNVLAAVRVTSRLLPSMRAAKWGRVLNISSLAALMPPSKRPDYAAAKAAMIAMTASLAKAVALDGITANTVSPGTIHSASLDAAFRTVAVRGGRPTPARRYRRHRLPCAPAEALRLDTRDRPSSLVGDLLSEWERTALEALRKVARLPGGTR